MNTEDGTMNCDGTDLTGEAADIKTFVHSLKASRQQRRNQLFSLVYPAIVDALKRSVTQKAILEALEAKGLKLHPSRFKELMKVEEMARSNGPAADGEAEQ